MPRSLNHQHAMEEGGLNPREGWRNIAIIWVFSRDVFSDFGGRRAQICRQVVILVHVVGWTYISS